jgi:hypothetical protein
MSLQGNLGTVCSHLMDIANFYNQSMQHYLA